jgi:O-methyltransferase
MKRAIKGLFRALGIEVRRAGQEFQLPVEFTKADAEIYHHITESKLTMATTDAVVATITAARYAVQSDITGDFVECGVWRGGNALAAKLIFDEYGSDKQVWLFDTFAGMTAPTEHDRAIFTDDDAEALFAENRKADHNEWCYASLEDVQANFAGLDRVKFVKGDVAETLRGHIPSAISVLRLDTDFYDSTKIELEVLYPLLSIGGALLIDDFGYWEGARKAVEEYFAGKDRPLLFSAGYSARMGVKHR